MLIAQHPEFVETMRQPTREEPWRVLVSGCIAGWRCGVDGGDYGFGARFSDLLALPTLRAFSFCPEQHALGTPRTVPDIHGDDGFDVVSGRARVLVLDENGADLTAQMLDGARAMVTFALESQVEMAVLADMSAACGSQVLSDRCRLVDHRRWQRGVGVATALLLEANIPVVAQLDHRTMALLRRRLDPTFEATGDELDHHDHPWVVSNLPGKHPRA